MLLPAAERTHIDPSNVRDHLLSDVQSIGRFEAAVFRALGSRAEEWHRLRDDLFALAHSAGAVPGQASIFGQKYEAAGTLCAPNVREAKFIGVWLALAHEEAPSFITAFPGQVMHKLLDTVALTDDLPEADLRKGDAGAVVEVLGPDAYEVEFVAASGRTPALVTLAASEVHALGDSDLISVRTLAETGT
ncbi:MAG TPA: DUF4926 domain-containing protein [Burkholderiaceae bacterium]|jgi:hypothetical protein|nr:DUF4926 domain-containing protein [Burkholderiaceae bacterium]